MDKDSTAISGPDDNDHAAFMTRHSNHGSVISVIAGAFSALALFIAGIGAAGAGQPGSAWAETDHTALRLIAAGNAVGETESVSLGLQFRMKKGWKIYWRSPGDAGFPPHVDWAGSDNLKTATLSWPAPVRFSILGFETVGYKDEVVLPIAATLAEPGRPLHLQAAIEYLTCKEICIPYQAAVTLDLPAGPATPSAFAHLINRYAVQVPGDGSAHGLAIDEVAALDGGSRLRVTAHAIWPFTAPDVYLEGPEEVQFSPPEVRLEDGARRAVLEVRVHGLKNLEGGLAGRTLTVTLVDGGRSAERALAVAGGGSPAGVGAATGSAVPVSLIAILGIALIGGLILNLMPCVLPVLSLKLLGVVGHGGGKRRAVRLSFIASAAGIWTSFLVLAGALIGLKAAGLAVGWGIQFQQPLFLIAMTIVVTLFACNLWGFFEVRLPQWIAAAGGRAGDVQGLGGHFLTGAFATLLATPCSAPFLGTAVSFAFSRGAIEILAVFATLGIGLSLPYLAVAAAPGLATRLPRPGPWIVVLRRVLGFALGATAVWLLSVLAAQVGVLAAALIGALMAGVGIALYLRARLGPRFARAAGAAVAVLAVLAFPVPAWLAGGGNAGLDANAAVKSLWTPFDEAAIAGHVAEGRIVFVDVTADWCITCQINKSFVLTKGRVIRRLTADGVVPMQADWTNPSDVISRYLAGFGRYGIPFDAVYGPGAPEGIALPELLTEEAVLSALERAGGRANLSAR